MTTRFTDEQIEVLLKPLASTRIAKRNISGSSMSYLQAYDVRAHMIRMFGFGGFDIETLDCDLVYEMERTIGQDKKPGYDIAYRARVRLEVAGEPTGEDGYAERAVYTEVAIGNAVGPVSNRADLHDNAAKSAVSDAMKRCAINLGTQFGLGLYNSGQTSDIVRKIVGRDTEAEKMTPEQEKMLSDSLGATEIEGSDPDGDKP